MVPAHARARRLPRGPRPGADVPRRARRGSAAPRAHRLARGPRRVAAGARFPRLVLRRDPRRTRGVAARLALALLALFAEAALAASPEDQARYATWCARCPGARRA